MRLNKISLSRGRTKPLNLALQGGGAHGAFTWGVLDRLLEEDRLSFDGVSGTSAGAVNAVALAAGLAESGRDGAKGKLAEVWKNVGDASAIANLMTLPALFPWPAKKLANAAQNAMQRLTKHLSPYDINPMDINPLRTLLTELIDFEELQEKQPIDLFISATDAASGQARIFRNNDISVDTVLASACLPQLFKAIEIDGRFYWDGGYSSNPDLLHLVQYANSNDTLLVQLAPSSQNRLPTNQQDILENINRITFNQPLIHELEVIYKARRRRAFLESDRADRKYRAANFHLINASHVTAKLDIKSQLTPEKGVLRYLFQAGREEASLWLESNLDLVGRKSTANLLAEFS